MKKLLYTKIPHNSEYILSLSIDYTARHAVSISGNLARGQFLYHIPGLDDQLPHPNNEADDLSNPTTIKCPHYHSNYCLSWLIKINHPDFKKTLGDQINPHLYTKLLNGDIFQKSLSNEPIPGIEPSQVTHIEEDVTNDLKYNNIENIYSYRNDTNINDFFEKQYKTSTTGNGRCDDLIIIDNQIVLIEAKNAKALPDCKIYGQLLSSKNNINNIIETGHYQGYGFSTEIIEHLNQQHTEIKYKLILCMVENDSFKSIVNIGPHGNSNALFKKTQTPGIYTTICKTKHDQNNTIIITFLEEIDLSDPSYSLDISQ